MINSFIVIPFINTLIVLYSLIPGHDFGLAIIAFTILIKIILWPFASKALHGQKAMQELQPEVQKLQEKYKNNKAELNKAVMELYKEKEVNPFGSCLPTLIQLPFLFGIFYTFVKFRNPEFINLADPSSGINTILYPFVKNLPFVKSALAPTNIFNTSLFGLINLAKPNVVIALLAAISQFFQLALDCREIDHTLAQLAKEPVANGCDIVPALLARPRRYSRLAVFEMVMPDTLNIVTQELQWITTTEIIMTGIQTQPQQAGIGQVHECIDFYGCFDKSSAVVVKYGA